MFARHDVAKRIVTATIAPVAALGLTIPCSAAADPTEDAFLRAVSSDGLVFATTGEVIERAQAVCAAFSAGMSTAQVHATVEANSAMSANQAAIFMARAVQFYCPQYSNQIFR